MVRATHALRARSGDFDQSLGEPSYRQTTLHLQVVSRSLTSMQRMITGVASFSPRSRVRRGLTRGRRSPESTGGCVAFWSEDEQKWC
jgi:hypothetical protein